MHNDERGIRAVEALKDVHFEGNIVPMEWFDHLKFDNGKPDVNAILILADIVSYYRKDLKGDLLQKSYQHYANQFGFSKQQVTDAISRLENRGIIKRVFKTIETSFSIVNNVLFIELDVEKVKQLLCI
jgi:hypothetical protein